MVRVAGVKGQVDSGVVVQSLDGFTPEETLDSILVKARNLKELQEECWKNLLIQLKTEKIIIHDLNTIPNLEIKWLREYFAKEIFPLMTPMAIDPAHPFPFVPNLGLCMAMEIEKKESIKKVLIPFSHGLDRFIQLGDKKNHFVKTEDLIIMCIDQLFSEHKIKSHGTFRLIRDSDIEFSDEAEDLVRSFENQLRQRRLGSVVLLEISSSMPQDLKELITTELEVKDKNIVITKAMMDISSVSEIANKAKSKLLWKKYEPRFPERIKDANNDCFAAIRKKDIIIHHPYESFDVVLQYLRQAAKDPKVLVIKQTLYRTSTENSAIVEALVEAAEEGKSVTALVELKARFDEEANIKVSRYLERYGVQVVYGFVDLKTHAKVSLVVRRERKGLNTYVHFGTGNYHVNTARLYTDLSLFTCHADISKDAQEFFNMATGYTKPKKWKYLSVAPDDLRGTLIKNIREEISYKKNGKNGEMWFKCNSLVDKEVIDALYDASQKGVRIELVVRGICCLRPQVKGLSDNIYVKSIVGRFLEHSRIYCFSKGNKMPSTKAKVFISSADIMPRNFDRRCEIMVPIINSTVHKQILHQIMVANLNDRAQSWQMNKDGAYERMQHNDGSLSAHEYFMSNPSLSGRGESIKYNQPQTISLKK